MTELEIARAIMVREGWPQFTKRKSDRGGATKGGITLESWREFSGNPQATEAELEQLTEEQAIAFYRERHITRPRFGEIENAELRELVIDCGVLYGVPTASLWLQQCVRVRADGRVGDITLAAVNAGEASAIFVRMCSSRIRKAGSIVSRDPELTRARAAGFDKLQAENAAGWNNRACEFLEQLAARLEASRARG